MEIVIPLALVLLGLHWLNVREQRARVLVLASYFIAPQPLDLAFGRAEVGSLFIAVMIGSMVVSDGRSNWYKGVQLITVYAIIALMFYLMPDISKMG